MSDRPHDDGVLGGGRFGVLFHELLRTHGPDGPGIQGTPPGGVSSAETQTTTAVCDGIGVVWTYRLFGYTREAQTLVDDAQAAARAAGVPPG